MNRKDFALKLGLLGVCPMVIQQLSGSELPLPAQDQDDKYKALLDQKQFVENWLADLLDSMETHTDRCYL